MTSLFQIQVRFVATNTAFKTEETAHDAFGEKQRIIHILDSYINFSGSLWSCPHKIGMRKRKARGLPERRVVNCLWIPIVLQDSLGFPTLLPVFNLLRGGSNRLEGEMRFPFHFRLLSCVCVKLFSRIPFWKVRNSFWEPTLSPYLMMQNEGEVDPEKYCRARASLSPWQPPSPFCLWSWVLSPLLLVLYFSTVSLNTVVGWPSGFECY